MSDEPETRVLVDLGGRGRALTYRVRGPVEIGDVVKVPARWWMPGEVEVGRVVQLGDGGYDGPAVLAWRVE